MKKDMQIERWAHMLDEATLDEGNGQLISDLENAFGGWIWQEGRNFSPNALHLKQMFRILNRHVFGGELDESVRKEVVDEASLSGLQRQAMATFAFGKVKGLCSERLTVVRHAAKDNFFVTLNSLAHEMVHMYDFKFGPMGKQLDKWYAVGGLNWNYPHPSAPLTAHGVRDARRLHMRAAGIEPKHLPDELARELDAVPRIAAQAHPRQYQFPAKPYVKMTPEGPMPATRPLDVKYRLGGIDGFYDVHGDFFRQLADRANSLGLDVEDVFYDGKKYAMRRVDEDPDETPEDLRYMAGEAVRCIFDHIRDEGKSLEFDDADNWRIVLV